MKPADGLRLSSRRDPGSNPGHGTVRSWRPAPISPPITAWKREAIEKLANVFDDKGVEVQNHNEVKLHAKIIS